MAKTFAGDETIRLTLACGRSAPRVARQAVRGVLGPGPLSDDAALVASELVTNAVQHSGCRPDQTITLDAIVSGGGVRIAVHDPGRSNEIPRLGDQPASEAGGLGLRVVAEVSTRWGSDRRDGWFVWAELAG